MIVHNDLTIGGVGGKKAETAGAAFGGIGQTLQGFGLPLKFGAGRVKIATSPANPCKFDRGGCKLGKKQKSGSRPRTDFH
jgi:hypothetical protein